ncbi:MAG: TlpA family protein disulfide reductase [Nanoarchaeota archaeon]|nr:TlpA family protein disulfide reductase [Nanoarchaeota archaeon]
MKLKAIFVKYLLGISVILLIFIAGCAKNVNISSSAVQQGQSAIGDIPVGNSKDFRAPDFIVTTTEGNTIKLSEITAQNKPVLVYFMATWCPYCTQDLAVVDRVYPKYKDQVEFIAIDLDLTENAQILSQYKTSRNHDFIFAPGYPEVLTDYGIRGTTAKFAVSREGIILYSGYGVLNDEQWETIFRGLTA